MKIVLYGALLFGACSSVVSEPEAATGSAGAGGANYVAASSASATGSTSAGGGVADAAPEAGECLPGAKITRCLDGCIVALGGACACDPLSAPNCPAGWWKICCAMGTACGKPDVAPGVEVIPACGPGAGPAWCVSQPYPCQMI